MEYRRAKNLNRDKIKLNSYLTTSLGTISKILKIQFRIYNNSLIFANRQSLDNQIDGPNILSIRPWK